MTATAIPRAIKVVTQNFGFSGPAGAYRTEVAGGSPRYGLVFERGIQQFRCTLILIPDLTLLWSLFYHHTIRLGTLPFSMLLDSGMGTVLHDCNIIPGSYSVTRNGPISVVTFSIEAEATAYAFTDTESAMLLAIWESLDVPSDLFSRIAQFANGDTLVLDF